MELEKEKELLYNNDNEEKECVIPGMLDTLATFEPTF